MLRASVLAILTASAAFAGEKPVPGPDWKLDYNAARREALRSGKPLFIYFTKTV